MEITRFTLKRLIEKINKKEITPQEVLETYLKRIGDTDQKIGAYLYVYCDPATIHIKETETSLSPLAGIPTAVKDNICTMGIPTTCASKLLKKYIPPYDSEAVSRLKSAGAYIIGKLNMDEFGMGSSTENSSIKLTRNPHDLSRVPGGSSGGAAAAVAAYEAPFALASDTGGSIRQPASFCGVVGMKPTYGSVSRSGLFAFASSFDQIGPVTRTVADNRMIFDIIRGKDVKDATTVRYPEQIVFDTRKKYKIGILSDLIDVSAPDVKDAVIRAAYLYEKTGSEMDIISFPELKSALSAYYIISSAEASSNLARYDGIRYGYQALECSDIEGLIVKSRSDGFGMEVKRRIMLGTAILSDRYYDAYYKKAQNVRQLITQKFIALFKKYDFLIAPTAPTTAFKFGEMLDNPTAMYRQDICTVPASVAGLPAITLPIQKDREGLPIGLQLIGSSFSEYLLYQAAEAIESEVQYHGL